LSYIQGRADAPPDDVVQAHLDGCAQCRVMMAEAARALVTHESGGTAHAARTLSDGELLGDRYQIRRFVARGGMGEVYETFDKVLGELVALKTLSLATVDRAEASERFLAEVRLARKVTHPNVCRILELGVHTRAGPQPESIPFFTMELYAGETLAARLARAGRLDPPEALRILRDVTAGMAAVHEAGIVHRDFKSDNVFLVARDGAAARAVVMDFGLARALPPTPAASSFKRTLVGTVDYMAPEQVEGRSATRASDIYAFGVVAFEMVTGRLPFSGETPIGTAVSRLVKEAPHPSTFRPELEEVWDRVIRRCLERDPAARFARIEDPVATLEQAAASVLPARRARRAVRAAVALAVAVGGAGALVALTVKRRPPKVATAPATLPVAAPTLPPPAPAPAPPVLSPPAPETAPVTASRRRAPRPRARVVEPTRSPSPTPPAPTMPDSHPTVLGDDDFIYPFAPH
jgi:tRNA A-37 threonylcarbamoyl transferase component Bud32